MRRITVTRRPDGMLQAVYARKTYIINQPIYEYSLGIVPSSDDIRRLIAESDERASTADVNRLD